MVAHGFSAEVQERLLAHNRALRAQITADPTSDCNHAQVAGPAPAPAAAHGLIGLRRR